MIKATLVLLAAHLVIPLLRRRSAAQRHALWTASLAIAAVLPVLTWMLPAWEPGWAQRAAEAWPSAFATRPPAVTAGDIVVRATGVESGPGTIAGRLSWLWGGGSLVLLLAFARQARRVQSLAATGVAASARHAAIAARVAGSLRQPPPRLACSAGVAIPLAWGIRRARILLPPSSRGWPDERVWAVCAHELAHISRGDWLWHLLAEIACRIYWFHPLFWAARRRLSHDSERAADDLVIGLGARGADYAAHLIEIVRASRADGPSPIVAMARGSGLERRVAALLDGFVNRARLSRGTVLAILIGAGVVAAPLAALSARARPAIEIRTSILPPIDESAARESTGAGGEPVREIRVINAGAPGAIRAPSVAEYTTPPLYSEDARQRGVEGVVVAEAHIDASGRVDEARIARGLGFGLDQNALVALRQWRFRPGTRGGMAAPMDVEIEIGFTLRSESINAQIANDMVSLVGPGVTPPQAVRVVDPRRTRSGAAGAVVLDVVLLEDGTPRVVRILRSLGAEADDIAVEAFAQWRFSPAQRDGRPIKVRMNAAVRFHD